MSNPQNPPIATLEDLQDWSEYFDRKYASCEDYRLRRYYAGGTVTADTPIVNAPLVAMDFETTGLNAEEHEIVSVGIVPFSMHRILCRESAHWLVKPAQNLTEGSVVIHGITHSDINAALDLESILEELLSAIAGKLVVVHFRHIEREFLACALLDRLGESIKFPVVDTMAIELQILRRQQGLMDRLFKRSPGSLRLGDCRRRYGLPHYQAHHALTDALATAELLQAQIAYHFSDDTPVELLWC